MALIPARGGSQGVPRKNLAHVCGIPLILHTVHAALRSRRCDLVVVSTDDPEIARVAQAGGARVPFIRPPELARSDTPMGKVVRHAVSWADGEGLDLSALVLLQPTSPLRTSDDIDRAVDLFLERRPSSVVSVVQIPHQYLPICAMRIGPDGWLEPLEPSWQPTRRQDKPALYARNGPAVVVTSAELAREGSLYGERVLPYVMDGIRSIDIDTPEDLWLANLIMRELKGREGRVAHGTDEQHWKKS